MSVFVTGSLLITIDFLFFWFLILIGDVADRNSSRVSVPALTRHGRDLFVRNSHETEADGVRVLGALYPN